MQENKEKKYKTRGVVGTIFFHIVVLIFLLLFGLSTIPKEEEGILVNLGDSKIGWGKQEPETSPARSNPKPAKTPPPVSKPQKTEKTKEQVKTQDFDDAPEVKSEEQKRKEEEKRKKKLEEQRKKEEQERLKREVEERQRKLEEERKRKEEEERKRQEEIERQKKVINSNVSNAFGKSSGSSTSEGDTKGSGNQGHVTGDPNSKNRSGSGLGSKGDGFQLAGRSLVGSLPKPQYSIQEEGVVVVRIKVDRNGYVVGAEYSLKGSTTQDSRLVNAAIKAAKQAKFNKDPKAPAFVYGTITYHFELD